MANQANQVDPAVVLLTYVKLIDLGLMTPSTKFGAPKYIARFLLDKKNPEHMQAVKNIQAVEEHVIAERWPKPPVGLRYALVDGDELDPRTRQPLHSPIYHGSYFLTAKSSNPVPVYIGRSKRPATPEDEGDIIHSGNIVVAGLRFFSYDRESKGVSAGLNLVWVTSKGERIGGASQAVDQLLDQTGALQFSDDLDGSPLDMLG